jgi:hypothetical protein
MSTEKISCKDFELLMSSLERQYALSPDKFKIEEEKGSIYFEDLSVTVPRRVYIVGRSKRSSFYVSISGLEPCTISIPNFIFSNIDRKLYNRAVNIFTDMLNKYSENIWERFACEALPAMKDIIAERIIVEDGDETSNSDT